MLRTICRAVHSALTDTSLLVVVQAVETIFLIYGDSTHDDLYALFKVEGILKSVLPRLKSKENVSLNKKPLLIYSVCSSFSIGLFDIFDS